VGLASRVRAWVLRHACVGVACLEMRGVMTTRGLEAVSSRGLCELYSVSAVEILFVVCWGDKFVLGILAIENWEYCDPLCV
jgi:hypothetical protein